MAQIEKRQVCKCDNCGNEAEMVVTCTLPDLEKNAGPTETRVKGTGTCSSCGNEADMWIDI